MKVGVGEISKGISLGEARKDACGSMVKDGTGGIISVGETRWIQTQLGEPKMLMRKRQGRIITERKSREGP